MAKGIIEKDQSVAPGPRLLLRIAPVLRGADPVENLEQVGRLFHTVFKLDGMALLRPDETTADLMVAWSAATDAVLAGRLRNLRLALGQGVAGKAFQTGGASGERTTDKTGDPSVSPAPWPPGVAHVCAAGLPLAGRVIGVMILFKNKGRSFTAAECAVLEAAAVMVAPTAEVVFAGMGVDMVPRQLAGHSKESLVHYLSHELKTPLAVLSASIALLERGAAVADDPKRVTIRERIERNLQRLLDMEYKLEDLLKEVGPDIRTMDGNEEQRNG